MEILIAGDVVPTQSNIGLFSKSDIKSLLGQELMTIWNSSDYKVFNLEVPLIDNEEPIAKSGPNLIAPTIVAKGIKALNPSLITIANNHILDQGIEGLNSTKNVLNNNNIPFIGAGDDISQASKPYVFDIAGKKIGIYTCAENEFTIAAEDAPGANPFDPLESLDHIYDLKKTCDHVIVIYHGGKEHYRYPSPYLQKVCRKMVEKGADLVVCQHSHCIGSFEKHNDATIVYGQGNFIFDYSDNIYWQTSLLLKVEINDKLTLDYIPIVKKGNVVRLAEFEEAKKILNNFHKRSNEIQEKEFVIKKYNELSMKNIDNYLRIFLNFSKWTSRIDRKLLNGYILKKKINKDYLLFLQNFIECEAHRELLLNGIKKMYRS